MTEVTTKLADDEQKNEQIRDVAEKLRNDVSTDGEIQVWAPEDGGKVRLKTYEDAFCVVPDGYAVVSIHDTVMGCHHVLKPTEASQ
jgi:hypothetical protein